MSINERIQEGGIDAAHIGARRYLDANKTMTDLSRDLARQDVLEVIKMGALGEPESITEQDMERMTDLASKLYLKTATKDKLIENCLEFGKLDLAKGILTIPGGEVIKVQDGLDIAIGERIEALREETGIPETDVLTSDLDIEKLQSKGAELYKTMMTTKVGKTIEVGVEKAKVGGVDGSAKYVAMENRTERTSSIEYSLNVMLGQRQSLDRGIKNARGIGVIPEPGLG